MRVKFTDGGVEPRFILARHIPIGVFKGRMQLTSSAEGVYLRTYDSIVDLQVPGNTWSISTVLEVHDYRPYTDEEVELVIHE